MQTKPIISVRNESSVGQPAKAQKQGQFQLHGEGRDTAPADKECTDLEIQKRNKGVIGEPGRTKRKKKVEELGLLWVLRLLHDSTG